MINFLIPSYLKVLSIQEMKIDDSSIIMMEFFFFCNSKVQSNENKFGLGIRNPGCQKFDDD